jgi:BMFP domain-containing protein YqiC
MDFLYDIFNNPILLLEVSVILTVFFIQIWFFIQAKGEAEKLSSIFDQKLLILDDEHTEATVNNLPNRLILLSSDSKNEINRRIKESVNQYLINNHGASINYSIIKDIVDREVDGKDEQVSNLIPLPLYLGLAATIVGIIFGLFAMPELGGSGSLDGIDQLMNGIKIAMFASLSGLVWTITLTAYIYNNAKQKLLTEKNLQLNYLQEKLLPIIFKDEDGGVLGLKRSIDDFSRSSNSIVTEINSVATKLESNIASQHSTLDKIEQLNITHLSKVNVELFDRIEKNMESFNKFSEFVGQLSVISENLKSFSNKTASIDSVAQKIDSNLEESLQLTRFLTTHFEDMEKMGDVALMSFDLSEKRFNKAIDKLTETTAEKIEGVKNVSDEIEYNFNKVYEKLFDRMDQIAKLHIEEFSKAYSESLPRFQKLEHLDELQEIKLQIVQAFYGINAEGVNDSNTNRIESANQKLTEIASLLQEMERNTRSLNGRVGFKSILLKIQQVIKKYASKITGK